MAVAIRTNGSGGAYYSAVNTKTITRPAGITAGDLIVAVCSSSAAITWIVPSGFSKRGPTATEDSGYTLQIFTKIATDSEPASYTFTASANTYGQVNLLSYAGAAAAMPLSRFVAQANLTSSQVDFPSVSAPVAGGAVLLAATFNSGITPAAPAGYVDRTAVPGGRSSVFDKLLASSGSTGTAAATFTGASTSIAVTLHVTPTVVAPENVVVPSLSGSPWSGGSLGANPNDWLGADAYTYVWKRDGVVI